MDASIFFAAAVGAGFVLLGLVVYSYVRPHPQHRSSITALLGLLGFALIASPNWTSISIRSNGMELSLLREMGARQLRALAEFRREAGRPLRPAAGPESGGRAAPDPAQTHESAAPPKGASDYGGESLEPPPPEHVESLFDALARGELDLRKVTDGELLALSELVTARDGPAQRRAR